METILVIDDSPTETAFVRAMLEKEDYRVIWAEDAKKGIDAALAEKPDLILMDVVMPGMNGFQATRQLRRYEQTRDTPIVMLTTKDQETDKIWALRNGANEYMNKPPKHDELMGVIRRFLR